MAKPKTKTTTVSPWLVATGIGAAMVGLWAVGRQWGESLYEDSQSPTGNPSGMDVGRQQNPAEAAWLETRQFVVPHAAPAERTPLPHTCDPLNPHSWGPGRVCVTAGDMFISVSPSSQHHVKKPGCTEVHFSENLQHFKMGDGWERGVLDRWLEMAPRVQTRPYTMLQMHGAGWPLSIGNMFAGVPGGMDILRAFAEAHYVKTPVGTIRIFDLPATPATNAFREEIAAHIAEVVS